jgi:hypothetical protein
MKKEIEVLKQRAAEISRDNWRMISEIKNHLQTANNIKIMFDENGTTRIDSIKK